MDIIIDTNIFRKDLKLKDKNYEILLDYLKKTNSNLVMPQIVLEETEGLYRRLLEEKRSELITAYNKLASSLFHTKLNELKEIDLEFEVEEFKKQLFTKLRITPERLINYKGSYLPDLVNRAINRIKPLGENGQQFRDGIIWLTMFDYISTKEDKRIVFISDNKSDFGEGNENKLNPILDQEAKKSGIQVFFFRSLADFSREHASSVDFINAEWIKTDIDFKRLESIFNKVISSDKEFVLISSKSELKSNEKPTGYLNETSYLKSNIIDFFVYEKSEGTILLNLTIEIEKEFEMEIEREMERSRYSYEYETKFNPRSGEMDIEPVFVPRIEYDVDFDYKFINPIFKANYVITIEDKKAIEYEFIGWEWE